MNNKLFSSLILLLTSASLTFASSDSVSVDLEPNYQEWGWDVLVVRNNFITMAIVPSIGARILQYDLGTDTFMIVNPALLGDYFYSANPTPYSTTWGYGGYKTWPAPQSRWNWPPPPTMAWGDYEYEIFSSSPDSLTVVMRGQTETIRTPGLRFDRYMTAYRNSTHIKVTTVLFNNNTTEQSWSIWDVTQTIVQHENLADFNNFSVYFPAESEDDIWGSGGPSYQEVLPGIYEAKYISSEGKIFVASSDGWVCFTDKRDGQTYAKVFDMPEGAAYTDDGASVEIYTNGGIRYMEVEVLGPYELIEENGDSIVFVEHWYATTATGPFYDVNHGGIVSEPLQYNRPSKTLTGILSPFAEGEFRVKYFNGEGTWIGDGPVIQVTPNELVEIEEQLTLPGNTASIEIHAYDVDGNSIARMGSISVASDDHFLAYRTQYHPLINGIADDACWTGSEWYPFNFVWLPYDDPVSPDDFSGRFKLSWTEDRLLILAEINDNVLNDSHSDPLQNYWDNDCLELFLDEDHSGGNHLNSFNAFAYHVGIFLDVVDMNTQSAPQLFNSHIDAYMGHDGGTYYTWELSVKVFDDTYSSASDNPVKLENNKEMGFSLAYCDNDGSATRENFIGSKYLPEAQSNDSYINASLFGTLTLLDTLDILPPESVITEKENHDFIIYPNPSDGIIHYEFTGKNSEGFSYQVFDVSGQMVASGSRKSQGKYGELDLRKAGRGTFIIKIVTTNNVYTKQTVVF